MHCLRKDYRQTIGDVLIRRTHVKLKNWRQNELAAERHPEMAAERHPVMPSCRNAVLPPPANRLQKSVLRVLS
jgi:hypothetical protein